MATETFHISSPLSQAEAFAMLADLTRVNEWDRGVTNAHQVEGDGPALGAKYEVTVTGFDGKPAQVVYELTEFDAPNRFVMIGEHTTFRAHDTLTLTPEGASADEGGCTLEYVGSLELMGDDAPLTAEQLDGVFTKVAAVAESGLTGFLNPSG